jgi:SAM-dependent methyltransferase
MSLAIHPENADQLAYWNGQAGRHWTDRQEVQDRVLAPITRLLFEAADIQPGQRIVDVGCGCGDTTLEAAVMAGPSGAALGVDISQAMLGRARERSAGSGLNAEFQLVDATVHDFSAISADWLISRFGVMFFANPALTFSNLRRGLKPGGRLAFVCWQEPKKNPWLMLPFQAMRGRVPPPPERGPEDPGPFSFADPERLRGILDAAGFVDVGIEARSLQLDTAIGQGIEMALRTALEIGPVSRALDGQPEDIYAAAEADIRTALQPYIKGETVLLGASVWIVTALNP